VQGWERVKHSGDGIYSRVLVARLPETNFNFDTDSPVSFTSSLSLSLSHSHILINDNTFDCEAPALWDSAIRLGNEVSVSLWVMPPNTYLRQMQFISGNAPPFPPRDVPRFSIDITSPPAISGSKKPASPEDRYPSHRDRYVRCYCRDAASRWISHSRHYIGFRVRLCCQIPRAGRFNPAYGDWRREASQSP